MYLNSFLPMIDNQKNKLVVRTVMLLVSMVVCTTAFCSATPNDSTLTRIRGFLRNAVSFSVRNPQEKVYVHFDNTSYYQGDKIWFKSYVVDGNSNRPSELSKTLYVELLNPCGKIVDKRILRIEDGVCHGNLSLGHMPFYSGFYEVRAYTKWMLNFGDAAYFSRVLPVFDAPKHEGDYSERSMLRSGIAHTKYEGPRKATKTGKKVNMRFYPEGGHMISGLPVRVTFEIVGKNGEPLDCKGRVVDINGSTVADISTVHEGRGVFGFTPAAGVKYKAIVTCGTSVNGEFKFDLPEAVSEGISLSVDNLSSADSMYVTMRCSEPGRHSLAGMSVSARGGLWSYALAEFDSVRTLAVAKRGIPTGVVVVSVTDTAGYVNAERLVFVDNGGMGRINALFDKPVYEPGEKVKVDIRPDELLTDSIMPLSVAVINGDNALDSRSSILTDLLMSPEVKGYLRNPMQYFMSDNPDSARDLDLLMMVRGWRRYSWEEMAGVKPIDLKYYPEQAIDLTGKVVSFTRSKPKSNVTISTMVMQKEISDSMRQMGYEQFVTDSCGNFRFSAYLEGKNVIVMSATENGKKKQYRIVVDRLFSPDPRVYDIAEMQIDDLIADQESEIEADNDTIVTETETSDEVPDDMQPDDDGKSRKLDEVVVKAKRRTKEADIYRARSKSVAYYDAVAELDDIADNNEVIGNDIFELLKKVNTNFRRIYNGNKEEISYKGRHVLFVINYEPPLDDDSTNYTYVYPEAVKAIYVNEEPDVMLKYADQRKYTIMNIDKNYGCAVLIETDPNSPARPGKGTRRLTIDGYSKPEEYVNVDAEYMIDPADNRRTLYWNPMLKTDRQGAASFEFYNNSSCRNMKITICGIDTDGNLYSN